MLWKAALAGLFFLFLGMTTAAAAEAPPQPGPAPSASASPPSPPPDTTDAYARKRQLVKKLQAHSDWYREDAGVYRSYFLWLTFCVLIGSLITSLLVAIDFAQKGQAAKTLVIALPLLTGLCTTILGQFNVRDVWKLREMGRIDALAMREKVRAMPTAATDVEMRTALLPFEQEMHDLERRQALAFFEYLTAKDGKKPDDEAPKK